MRTLVVSGHGVRLRVSKGVLVVEHSGGREAVPLAELERIVIATGGVSVTSSFVRKALGYGIDIVFLDSRGVPIARLYPPWITRTVESRRAQYLAYADTQRRTAIAVAIAAAKLGNQASYLRYLARRTGEKGLGEEASRIGDYANQLYRVAGERDWGVARQRILSIEGNAARIYWGAYATLLPRDLGFPGRDRDSGDPVNTVLNYLYGILYAEAFKALARVGLDPYAGFLHSDRSGKPVLTFDFVEMFRVSAVDSLAMKLLRQGYRPVVEQGLLNHPTRAFLVKEFYRWLERRARPWTWSRSIALGEALYTWASALAKSLRSGSEFQGFVERWP
ncbi:MAG: CRISPR-associated endonuclease Cas1 [Thermoprotei archaeon]|nr:MAG: CRISPR-associated endonuclease Cas1 [Thermoprotei archaeon]